MFLKTMNEVKKVRVIVKESCHITVW